MSEVLLALLGLAFVGLLIGMLLIVGLMVVVTAWDFYDEIRRRY